MKQVTAILVGAGNRGMDSYAPYALRHPQELKFVGVAEPIKERRQKFQKEYNISEENCFTTWEEILQKPKMADAVLISTQDQMHTEPTRMALEKGYHVLLEKPMAVTPEECVQIGKWSKEYDRKVVVCHVLRYCSFFSTLKLLLDEDRIGQLVSIQHNENVGNIHQSHSFVRGNWRNTKESSPMILAKCCHDMDIILWLAGTECTKVGSFGSLMHFKKENAPEGAPKRCLDGCPIERQCPYNAAKIYLTEEKDHSWAAVVMDDLSMEGRMKALKEGPYGRCVYHCDNDVVDHQVVSMEFENGVTAAFTMCAFTNETSRTIKLMGTKGEIRGHMDKNEITIYNFETGIKEEIHIPEATGPAGHGDGDEMLMADFVELMRNKEMDSKSVANVSVQSHLIAFSAEISRVEGRTVDMKEQWTE